MLADPGLQYKQGGTLSEDQFLYSNAVMNVTPDLEPEFPLL